MCEGTNASNYGNTGTPHHGAPFQKRFYRKAMGQRFRSWSIQYKESDLWIGVSPESWSPQMEKTATAALMDARKQIEGYGRAHKSPVNFFETLAPMDDDPSASPVVRAMLQAGVKAKVGPMAAVAGAIAEHIGKALATSFECTEIIVENGGDLWLAFANPLEIAVFAGDSPLSVLLAVELEPELSPCGLCTSSGTVGPSLSFGYADAAVILCRDAATADAWATAAGNMVQTANDIEPTLAHVRKASEVLGALIVVGDRMGMQGNFRLKPLPKVHN